MKLDKIKLKEEMEEVNIKLKELEDLNDCLNERLANNIKLDDKQYKEDEIKDIKDKLQKLKKEINDDYIDMQTVNNM